MSFSFERIVGHGAMLADKVRMESYRKAIHETVKRGDIVCDIGTGSGILAFFALQAGAEKVYAIEQNEIIKEAKKIAELNGLEKRIIFIKNRSDKVELPEKVDVITSELIGFFGLEENLHRFKIDARNRFLKPDGRLLPRWLELYLVPVESEEIWNKTAGLWSKDFYGVDFSGPRKKAASQRFLIDCSNKIHELAPLAMISRFDFFKIENLPSTFTAKFISDKKGYLHGLTGYFKAGLSENTVLSTSPHEPCTHWQQVFFPMEDAIAVIEGDEITCTMKAIPHGEQVFWQWDTQVLRKDHKLASFSQGNFNIPKSDLVLGRGDFKPGLLEEAGILQRVLSLCDGKRTMKEISEIIFTEYPQQYKDVKETMRQVIGFLRGRVSID